MHHKTNDDETHTHTHTYAHTQLCDWQRLLQTSTLKLSENHKRFSVLRVCVFACVYLWNFPQRKTHQKKPHWTHTHTHTTRSSCTRVCVHVCMYLWRRERRQQSSVGDGDGDGDCETSPLYVSCLRCLLCCDSASLADDASTSSQRLVVVIYRFHRSPTLAATVTSPQNPLAEHLYLRSRCCRLTSPSESFISEREWERGRLLRTCVCVCLCV